jgi:hypothetical protein
MKSMGARGRNGGVPQNPPADDRRRNTNVGRTGNHVSYAADGHRFGTTVGAAPRPWPYCFPFFAPASASSTSVAWATPVAPRGAYGVAFR